GNFLLLRRVVAHPVSAEPTGFAPVAAEAAVVGVVEHVDAPAAAAHLPEPAPPPAPSAVEEVRSQVHAQPPAAVRPGASPRPTAHPRHLVARLESSRPVSVAERVVASEPRWRVLVPVHGGHGKRMRRGHGHGHGQCNGEYEASHLGASRERGWEKRSRVMRGFIRRRRVDRGGKRFGVRPRDGMNGEILERSLHTDEIL
ncbi:unnamed protein product, partial [Musa acuminata subsp. burmannicoides]